MSAYIEFVWASNFTSWNQNNIRNFSNECIVLVLWTTTLLEGICFHPLHFVLHLLNLSSVCVRDRDRERAWLQGPTELLIRTKSHYYWGDLTFSSHLNFEFLLRMIPICIILRPCRTLYVACCIIRLVALSSPWCRYCIQPQATACSRAVVVTSVLERPQGVYFFHCFAMLLLLYVTTLAIPLTCKMFVNNFIISTDLHFLASFTT